MPFKRQEGGAIQFVRLPLDKCVYGVEKGEADRRYFYLRRFDLSGLNYDSLGGFAGSAIECLSGNSSENDWIIPIKSTSNVDYKALRKYDSFESVSKLLGTSKDARPWFSIVRTPNNVAYFTKRRLSASSTLQAVGLGVSLLNPVTAIGAFGWFTKKQQFKYNMARSRGEEHPSIIPKVFIHKIWQVSLTGDYDEIYSNIAAVLESGDAWIDWS